MSEIKVVPCWFDKSFSKKKQRSHIEVDGKEYFENGKRFCGTEAEALEKAAELCSPDAYCHKNPEPAEQAAPPRPLSHCGTTFRHLPHDDCDGKPNAPKVGQKSAAIEQARPAISSVTITQSKGAASGCNPIGTPIPIAYSEQARPQTFGVESELMIILEQCSECKGTCGVHLKTCSQFKQCAECRMLNGKHMPQCKAAAAEPAPERTLDKANELSEFLWQNERIFDYVFYRLITPKKAIEAMGEIAAGNKPALPPESEIDAAEERWVNESERARAVAVPETPDVESTHAKTK